MHDHRHDSDTAEGQAEFDLNVAYSGSLVAILGGMAQLANMRRDTQRAIDEAEIRQRIDKLVAAIRVMDLDSVMSIYAPDIVSFDLEPPLQHVGAEAKRKNWLTLFRCTSVRSATRFAISRSPWAMTWLLGTASFGSAAR